jgi:hypothetical protein
MQDANKIYLNKGDTLDIFWPFLNNLGNPLKLEDLTSLDLYVVQANGLFIRDKFTMGSPGDKVSIYNGTNAIKFKMEAEDTAKLTTSSTGLRVIMKGPSLVRSFEFPQVFWINANASPLKALVLPETRTPFFTEGEPLDITLIMTEDNKAITTEDGTTIIL